MTSQWLQGWARSVSKCAGQSYESVDTFSDSLYLNPVRRYGWW